MDLTLLILKLLTTMMHRPETLIQILQIFKQFCGKV